MIVENSLVDQHPLIETVIHCLVIEDSVPGLLVEYLHMIPQ